jgi:hypothetical protein
MARLRLPKSLTIDCEDTQGSILASLVNGVIVNSSTAHVKLRGLSINGAGNGINCVRVIRGGERRSRRSRLRQLFPARCVGRKLIRSLEARYLELEFQE